MKNNSQDHKIEIEKLEKERECLQGNLDNISGVSTETKEEKEIRIWAEKRIQVLDSYIKTAKTELRAINPTQDKEEKNKMNELERLEKQHQGSVEKIERLEKKRIKIIFEIALDAKTKEINKTKELIMILLDSETTARKNRKDLERDLKYSLEQMNDMEEEYNKT